MTQCNITSKELADALDITQERLVKICDIFDEDPDDDWELTEGIHFEWAAYKSRNFSYEGAIEICNYLEGNKRERTFFNRFQRWFFRRDDRLKGLMIAKQVQEEKNKGELIFRNQKAFLSPRSCRKILGLGTRQDVLNRTFDEIQRCENTEIEVLKIESDFFIDQSDARYFSGSGIAYIGQQLGVKLTKKHRREYVKIVAEYAPKAIATIEKNEAKRDQRIQAIMEQVRKKARGRCQLTNRLQQVHHFNLEVHHLYDKNTYPKFADMEINLIAIGHDIHKDFHKWMGGTNVSCTIRDLEKYIEEFSHSLFADNVEQATKVAIHISDARNILEKLL